jgi:hypothetical protein
MNRILRTVILISGILALATYATTRLYDYRISRLIEFNADIQLALETEQGYVPIMSYRFAEIIVARNRLEKAAKLSIIAFVGLWGFAFIAHGRPALRMLLPAGNPAVGIADPAVLRTAGERGIANGLLCAIGSEICWQLAFDSARTLPVNPGTVVIIAAGLMVFILKSRLLWKGYRYCSAAAERSKGVMRQVRVALSASLLAGDAILWLILVVFQIVLLAGGGRELTPDPYGPPGSGIEFQAVPPPVDISPPVEIEEPPDPDPFPQAKGEKRRH